MVLGEKLQNPYTVENMKSAYSNLKKNDKNIPQLNIFGNYHYVRFLPTSYEEYTEIASDDNLDLYNYPLDFEIKTNGNYYKAPDTKNNQYTWFYAVIPHDYKLNPKIKSEILAKLFLPRGNGNKNSYEKLNKNNLQGESIFDDLENEALRITTNLKSAKNGKVNANWIPKGTILVFDDVVNRNIPVAGCKVRTRRWFSTETAITDNTGFYNIGVTYTNDANFSIEWERADFDIRSGTLGQAYFNGPKQTGDWNLLIEKNGMSFVYAHLHRAANDYWYNNQIGIKTPNKNLGGKIKIGAFDGSGRANYSNRFIVPDIEMYRNFSSGVERNASQLYAITFHELAHTSHRDLSGASVYSTNTAEMDRIAESWAVGVESVVGRRLYPNYRDFEREFSFSVMRTDNDTKQYTPLVVDLMDNSNQRARFGNSTNFPVDNVNGYTLKQIEDALKGVKTLDEWRLNLFNMYTNPTEGNLVELFNNYKNL